MVMSFACFLCYFYFIFYNILIAFSCFWLNLIMAICCAVRNENFQFIPPIYFYSCTNICIQIHKKIHTYIITWLLPRCIITWLLHGWTSFGKCSRCMFFHVGLEMTHFEMKSILKSKTTSKYHFLCPSLRLFRWGYWGYLDEDIGLHVSKIFDLKQTLWLQRCMCHITDTKTSVNPSSYQLDISGNKIIDFIWFGFRLPSKLNEELLPNKFDINYILNLSVKEVLNVSYL